MIDQVYSIFGSNVGVNNCKHKIEKTDQVNINIQMNWFFISQTKKLSCTKMNVSNRIAYVKPKGNQSRRLVHNRSPSIGPLAILHFKSMPISHPFNSPMSLFHHPLLQSKNEVNWLIHPITSLLNLNQNFQAFCPHFS